MCGGGGLFFHELLIDFFCDLCGDKFVAFDGEVDIS